VKGIGSGTGYGVYNASGGPTRGISLRIPLLPKHHSSMPG
jgi:hypothetical protein